MFDPIALATEKNKEEEKGDKEENSEKPSEEKKSEKSKKEKTPEPEVEKPKKKSVDSDAVIDLASEKEPRALHKTSSIFLRNLAPTITKAEVEAVIIFDIWFLFSSNYFIYIVTKIVLF